MAGMGCRRGPMLPPDPPGRATRGREGRGRLSSHTATRVIAIAGMRRGEGATTAAMNLGAALVHQGKDVLLLDEHHPAADSIGALWVIDPPGVLADVAERRLTCAGAA